MFGKLFGKKKETNESRPAEPQASKGYHSCVDSCERDIENLETECENLRKDNTTLMGRVSTLEVANKELKEQEKTSSYSLDQKDKLVTELEDRIKELEQRLEEADEKADGTPVKYASARKTLTQAKLKQLRKALEAAPAGAQGFGGSCSVYDKKTKRVSLVEFKSKQDALDLLSKAEKGNVDIIM